MDIVIRIRDVVEDHFRLYGRRPLVSILSEPAARGKVNWLIKVEDTKNGPLAVYAGSSLDAALFALESAYPAVLEARKRQRKVLENAFKSLDSIEFYADGGIRYVPPKRELEEAIALLKSLTRL